MKFSTYVSLREEERTATIQMLLMEIEALEKELEHLVGLYSQLKSGEVVSVKKRKVGF